MLVQRSLLALLVLGAGLSFADELADIAGEIGRNEYQQRVLAQRLSDEWDGKFRPAFEKIDRGLSRVFQGNLYRWNDEQTLMAQRRELQGKLNEDRREARSALEVLRAQNRLLVGSFEEARRELNERQTVSPRPWLRSSGSQPDLNETERAGLVELLQRLEAQEPRTRREALTRMVELTEFGESLRLREFSKEAFHKVLDWITAFSFAYSTKSLPVKDKLAFSRVIARTVNALLLTHYTGNHPEPDPATLGRVLELSDWYWHIVSLSREDSRSMWHSFDSLVPHLGGQRLAWAKRLVKRFQSAAGEGSGCPGKLTEYSY